MAGLLPDDFWVEWHPTRSALADVGDLEWTRIANGIRELAASHGFERKVDRVEAGTLTVVFDDRDRSLDPTNPWAPDAGGFTPLRHVRLRALVGSTTLTLWRGFTVSWDPDWAGGDGWVTLQAKDSLMAAARVLRENTLSTAIAALAPDMWLPLDDGGTALAQGADAASQDAVMTSTSATGPILPFADQASTTFPHAGLSKGDLAMATLPYSLGSSFSLIAVVKVDRDEGQVILANGPNPAGGACPSGDIALTVDSGQYYLRVGNLSGSSLLGFGRPPSDPSVILFARYNTLNSTLWASQGYRVIGGGTYANSGLGGTWTPRAGVLRVGNGLDSAMANPFLGSLAHVAAWTRQLSDSEARSIFAGYWGLVGPSVGSAIPGNADDNVGWVLDRLGIPSARRDLDATGTKQMGGMKNDLTALELMSRAAATEGGYFFADRAGNYVLRLRGAVGSFRGGYDTRPADAVSPLTAAEQGLETDPHTWMAQTGAGAVRDTAQASAGAASLAVRRLISTASVTVILMRNQWSAADSALSAGTTGPWVPRSGATIANPGTAGRDGTAGFLRITGTGGDAVVDAARAWVPVAAGRALRSLGYIRAATVARSARLFYDWYDAYGTYISTTLGATITPIVSATGMSQMTVNGLPPAGAKWAQVGVRVIGALSGETWDLDDVVSAPPGFACRPGQSMTFAAKAKASAAGKLAYVGAFFYDETGAEVTSRAVTATISTTGFTPVAGADVVPAGAVWYAPSLAVGSMAVGETVWFDEIDVRLDAGAALADVHIANDDRTFATVARMQVTTAAQPQIVEYRHPNADDYGEVIDEPATMFANRDDAAAAAIAAVGDATPRRTVVDMEVLLGAAGVDPEAVLSSDILDQAVATCRIPGPIGWSFHARDAFLGVSTTSLGTTGGGTGVTDIATWVPQGANTWGKDAAGAYRNGATGHQQVTILTGAPDHKVFAALWPHGDYIGVVARWVDPANHLLLQVDPVGGAGLYEVLGGAYNLLAAFGGVAAGERWGIGVAGTVVTVYRNGVAVATATTSLTGQRVGLNAYNGAGSVARANDFEAIATQLALEPFLALGTIVRVEHRYDRAGTWRCGWSLIPAD